MWYPNVSSWQCSLSWTSPAADYLSKSFVMVYCVPLRVIWTEIKEKVRTFPGRLCSSKASHCHSPMNYDPIRDGCSSMMASHYADASLLLLSATCQTLVPLTSVPPSRSWLLICIVSTSVNGNMMEFPNELCDNFCAKCSSSFHI